MGGRNLAAASATRNRLPLRNSHFLWLGIQTARSQFNVHSRGAKNMNDDAKVPEEYAAELRAQFPDITDAGIASFWRARHLQTD